MSPNGDARRLDELERNAPVTVTAGARSYAERLAIKHNISAKEILEEAARILKQTGPNAPLEPVAAELADELNIPVDELLSEVLDIQTGMEQATEGNQL